MNNRQALSKTLRPLWHSLIWVAVSFMTFLLLIAMLIVIQGQRNEVRSAGAVIVVLPSREQSSSQDDVQSRLDHSIDLYQRGYVNRIIVVEQEDQTRSEIAQYVVDRRLPSEVLLFVRQGHTPVEQLAAAVDVMRLNGIESVLLSSEPYEMLRMLKIARDVGMDVYGVPIRRTETPLVEDAVQILREAWAYIRYVLLG